MATRFSIPKISPAELFFAQECPCSDGNIAVISLKDFYVEEMDSLAARDRFSRCASQTFFFKYNMNNRMRWYLLTFSFAVFYTHFNCLFTSLAVSYFFCIESIKFTIVFFCLLQYQLSLRPSYGSS